MATNVLMKMFVLSEKAMIFKHDCMSAEPRNLPSTKYELD